MGVAVVRYTTKPDRADENEALIEKVFAELEAERPAGLHYASFRLADRVSFVHIAAIDTADGSNPLTATPAFADFVREIADRCEVQPVAVEATLVGAYRFLDAPGRRRRMTAGQGTPESPWTLTTPSGGSQYTAYRDESREPPALVVQVGKTQLQYDLRCLDDLHAMLVERGDWVPLGNADEQKTAAAGTVESWARADGQSGRRLVRAQEGLARTLRQLRAARDGSAGARRGRAQRAEQPDARAIRERPRCVGRAVP